MRQTGKMNPEWKKKWLEALRSGTFVQGTQFLKREIEGQNTFCCLGVLCELVNPEGWKVQEPNLIAGVHSFKGEVSGLPEEVQVLTGIVSGLGHLARGSLASLNDQGKSFKRIADIIEEEL